MGYIYRNAQKPLEKYLKSNKSVLLLGPRQTGKTTLLEQIPADLRLSLVAPRTRRRYEKDPGLLSQEIEQLQKNKNKKRLRIIVDEVQKVPELLDVAQDIIDRDKAQFILTGSSARKLRRMKSINLLPGRVLQMYLDPLSLDELDNPRLEDLLLQGSLPGVLTDPQADLQDAQLESYVDTYLEEEVRAEALVRNLGAFSRFLELVGIESGKIFSFRNLSQELGISHTTVADYFGILEDCLIAERIEPITHSATRKKLTRSCRYLLFDMGVRRFCAREPRQLSNPRMGELFEHWVGLELVRLARHSSPKCRLRFWRDPGGPEVDWVLERNREYIPVEVKWNEAPKREDAKHLRLFLSEYPQAKKAYIVCRTPRAYSIDANITALPWQAIPSLIAAVA